MAKYTKAEEAELRKKLGKTLLALVSIIVTLVLLIVFFAPKLGMFFGLFSRHRNEIDQSSIIKPASPIFSAVPSAVKEEKVTLNGYAQPGLTIVIFVNGPEADKTTVGADGLFTFNEIQLINGNNTISAKAIDQQGIESDQSKAYSITVDKEKPKITIDSPKNDATIRNLDKRIEITGKLNEKSTIKINGRMAILRPDLTFKFLLGVQDSGTIEIKVEATDEAGNTAEEKFKVFYKRES